MIQLTEIAKKIENVLNGDDAETSTLVRPNDFYFKVENVGYHIDHIYDKESGKNFIPVYIDLLNGEYDPISSTKRATYTISITLYFPVRFKDSFFTMADFLYDVFVGKIRNYGTITGSCLSNISPSEYGEILETDFTQYKQWVTDVYKETITRNEKWMTMSFKLYLSTAKSEFVFGNSISYKLRFKAMNNGTLKTYEEDLSWTQSGSGMSNSPIAQQLIDADSYAKNVINITNYSKSIVAYFKTTEMWLKLLDLYNNNQFNDLSDLELVKTYNFGNGTTKSYSFNQVALSFNENNAIGELISFTIAFGDR